MTQTNNQVPFKHLNVSIKECAHLYDVNNKPKILPGKYAVSPAELVDDNLYYNHTPKKCLHIVQEAKLE